MAFSQPEEPPVSVQSFALLKKSGFLRSLVPVVFALCRCWAEVQGAGAAELPTWRVEGTIENWRVSSMPDAPAREDLRKTLFRLEFSEGGQWSIQTRSSVDSFKQMREAGCQRGDLFQIMHDAPGRVAIAGRAQSYRDAAYVCPGPMTFFTSQIGAIWWLFCARHAFQGQTDFSTSDFMGTTDGGTVHCQIASPPGQLGISRGEMFPRPPQVNDFPVFEWEIQTRGQVAGKNYPQLAMLRQWTRGSAFAPRISTVYSVACTNVTRVARPSSFRPALRPASWVMDERLAFWRVEYIGADWLAPSDLQARLRTGRGIKGDYLGPQPLPPRVSSPFAF